jgi:hypothetical protein
VKKFGIIFVSLSALIIGISYYFSTDRKKELHSSYRHHFTDKEKKEFKKNSLKSADSTFKSERSKERKLAQVDQETISIANPNRKKEEFKEEYSLRGRENISRATREPSSKIVYGDGKGNVYKLLDDYYAVKKTNQNANDYPDSELRLGYFIVSKDNAPSDALRVMENAQTGRAAIFTGLIKVKLADISLADNLVRDFDYEILYQYDHISLVMYKFNSFEETMAAKKTIDTNPNVKRATIELLEYERIEQ